MVAKAAKIWWRRTVGRYPSTWQIHPGDFVMLRERELAVFGLEGVDMY